MFIFNKDCSNMGEKEIFLHIRNELHLYSLELNTNIALSNAILFSKDFNDLKIIAKQFSGISSDAIREKISFILP